MTFTPRLDCPKADNRYYIAKSEGGLNPAIPRPSDCIKDAIRKLQL